MTNEMNELNSFHRKIHMFNENRSKAHFNIEKVKYS